MPAQRPSFASPPLHAVPPSGAPWTAVELPPDLPVPAYTSLEMWNDQRVGALAVYCSDGRWGEAFDEFCHWGLGIPRYDRFAVPGGPAWFAHDDEGHPELFKAAREQIEFLVRAHDLRRVVLFTHWGCAFYRERNGGKGARESWPLQLRDVRTAAATVNLWFPLVRVETYLAMNIGSQMTFHRLNGMPAPSGAAKMTVPAGRRL